MFQLYPQQELVVSALRRNWKQHNNHLVNANVGFGKTAIAYHLVSSFNKIGKRVLFVAPYTTLVQQTAERFMSYGLEQPSIIWQNHSWYDEGNLCQIASVDTLRNRPFPDIDLLIIDECHIKRKFLLEIIKDADFPVIGLSGTPYTDWLGQYYTSYIKETTMKQMIAQGNLSEYEIFAPTKPDLSQVKTSQLAEYGEDYVEAEIAAIMQGSQIVGDVVGNWLKRGENLPTIAFCCNVAHANHLTIEFNKVGVKAEVMTAKTKKEEREAIISRFEQGITRIICNVGVLVAGFDSDVRCCIYARPTKSEIRWVQCLGRALRTAEGKDRALIFDHSGTVHRLGMPCDIEYDRLASSKDGLEEIKQERKQKEQFEKKAKECKQCNYMKPAGEYICSKCGFKPLLGEDVEADESRELESLTPKKKRYTKEEKQRFYSELYGVLRESHKKGKPMKEGRIYYLFKSKFNQEPKGLSKTPIEPSAATRGFIKHKNIAFAKARAKA